MTAGVGCADEDTLHTRHFHNVQPLLTDVENFPIYNSLDSPVCVSCIDFSPFGEAVFLVGCADGAVRLYAITSGEYTCHYEEEDSMLVRKWLPHR